MAQPIGVTVIERPAATGPAIIPADITNTGIIVESQRGPVNTPTEVASDSESRLRFGGPQPELGRYGALAIRALYRNAAPFGARVFVSRVVGAGSDEAEVILASDDNEFEATGTIGNPNNYTLTIEAGTLVGKKVTLKDAVVPTRTEVYDNIGNTAELCDAINRGVTGGADSLVTYSLNATPGPLAASLLVTVNYAGYKLPDDLTETAFSGSPIVVAGDPALYVSAVVDPIPQAGQRGLPDPGDWGNAIRITATPSVAAEYNRDITITQIISGEAVVQETFTGVADFAAFLNSADVGSNYVWVANAPDTDLGNPNPVTLEPLAGGLDGADPGFSEFEGTESAGSGLYAFDGENIQMLTTADLTTADFAKAMADYCEGRGDVVAVWATDESLTLDTLEDDWSPVVLKQKSWGAGYRGWIIVNDEAGGRVQIPGVGHVIGAGYIRRVLTKSNYPHIAPAGLDVSLRDLFDLEFRNISDTTLERLVHEIGINAIMFVPNRGFVVRTSRTVSTLSPNYSVHIRRSLNFIRTTLLDNLGFLEQEPNNPTTRTRTRDVLTNFFQTLFNAEMFEQRGGYDNNVAVKCDEENNPISVVNQRKLVVDVTLRFVEIAELIEVNLQATREGILIQESVA